MKRKQAKKILSIMIAVIMFVCSYTGSVRAENSVKHSETNYYVEMDESWDLFIYNKRSIGSRVGTEYYLTYTVESLDTQNTQFNNQGIIGTNTPVSPYPYVTTEEGKGGLYKLTKANRLLVEGNTYFFKFKVTEDGYDYTAGWAKDDGTEAGRSKYIKLDEDFGEVRTDLGYFGVYFGAMNFSGKLVKVRCYDKNGNDLGVEITGGRNATVGRENPIAKDQEVEHTYTISVKDSATVAISNKKIPTSNTVYMEYKVKESAGTHVYQTGVIHNSAPLAGYPYESGMMRFNRYEYDPEKVGAGPLLVAGAEYLIVFEKRSDTYDVTIQQTLDGKVSFITLEQSYGTFAADGGFYSLWFGEGPNFPVNIELTDFKCYDSNKNNLSVQCNKTCEIIHFGELEDYSGCEAMYFCEDNNALYALYEDQSLKYAENGTTEEGSYRIEKDVMTVLRNSQKADYDYMYTRFADEEGKEFWRLGTYKVTFATGDGSAVETQIINAEDGYVALKPTDPTLEGNTFKGWYTSEGEEYLFDNIVSRSITLYAKWENVEYTALAIQKDTGMVPYVVTGGCVIILLASLAGGVCIIVRGKRHAHKE